MARYGIQLHDSKTRGIKICEWEQIQLLLGINQNKRRVPLLGDVKSILAEGENPNRNQNGTSLVAEGIMPETVFIFWHCGLRAKWTAEKEKPAKIWSQGFHCIVVPRTKWTHLRNHLKKQRLAETNLFHSNPMQKKFGICRVFGFRGSDKTVWLDRVIPDIRLNSSCVGRTNHFPTEWNKLMKNWCCFEVGDPWQGTKYAPETCRRSISGWPQASQKKIATEASS